MAELEEVLAGWRADAVVLRRNDEKAKASLLERCSHDVESAAADYLSWLTEEKAIIKSGKSREWLRKRWDKMRMDGNARLNRDRKSRLYRSCAIPRQQD
jgi:hypothetical protein